MRIESIEVENFRSIREPLRVEFSATGLCVVAGANEDGKSTLVDAVRTVFFERHRLSKNAAQAMLPFGCRVQPRIAVDFLVHGKPHRIEKAFVQQPSATLTMPTGTYSDDDAERELQRLLQTTLPTRGMSKPENRGIWGLLWVEQGKGFEAVSAVGTAQRVLQTTLEQEVGDVLAGDLGTTILAAVRERKSLHFHKRGTRGELKLAEQAVAETEAELARLDGELGAFETEVQTLGDALQEQQALQGSAAVERALQAQKTAEAAAAKLASLRSAAQTSGQQLALATATLKHQRQLRVQRDELIESLAAKEKMRREHAHTAKALSEKTNASTQKLDQLQRDMETAQATIEDTAARLDTAKSMRVSAKNQARLRVLKKRLRVARRHQKDMQQARERASANPVDDAALHGFEAAYHALQTAEARLDAGAAMVTVRINGRNVRVGGTPVQDDTPVRMTQPTEITIDGVGTISVDPGGDDLQRRLTEREEARRSFNETLAALGFEDGDGVRHAWQTRRDLMAEAWNAERRVFFEAPGGIDAVELEVASLKDSMRAQLEASGWTEVPDPTAIELEVRQLEALLVRQQTSHEAMTQAHNAHATEHAALGKMQIESQTTAGLYEQDAAALGDRLGAARKEHSDATVKQGFADAVAMADLRQKEHAKAKQTLDEANPAALEETLATATQTHDALRAKSERLAQTIHDARLSLTASGRGGLGEIRDDTHAALAQANARLAELTRDADATRLLADVLERAEKDAKDEFLTPIAKRMTPLLNQLMPGAELNVDADLRVHGLRRTRGEEPFESLSVGTREQIAVLTRLAFADILRAHGQETPIFLDDALVYSDDTRFSAMKRILQDAATHQQIIVMTCRLRDWEDVGAPTIYLNDRTAAQDAQSSEARSSEAPASQEAQGGARESVETRVTVQARNRPR